MSDPSDRIKAAVEREFLHPSKRRPHYLERVSIVLALRELRHRVKPGLILDVGCGMKPYESLLNTSGSKYYGTDYPITMEGSYGDSTRADFFSDSMVLPFREGTFDTVISTQMLEHVRKPEVVVYEMSRVLKPDGILILSAPMTWPLHEEPYDFYRYTLHGLRHLLEEADFEILDEVRRGKQSDHTGADVPRHPTRQHRPSTAAAGLLHPVKPSRQPGVQRWQPVQASSAPLPWMGDGRKKNVRRGINPDGHQTV